METVCSDLQAQVHINKGEKKARTNPKNMTMNSEHKNITTKPRIPQKHVFGFVVPLSDFMSHAAC